MTPEDVILLPLGVGEAFTRDHFTTCLAFGSGDDWILLDCPHPIRRMLGDASRTSKISLDLDKIRAVVLSHLHADHACGIEDYLYYSSFALKRRATIVTHPSAAERLWPNLLAAGMDRVRLDESSPPIEPTLADYCDLIVSDENRPVDLGPFHVESRPTRHSIPTRAYRVSLKGLTLGFSADTVFDPALIEWLAPCDLIVHEATNLPESPVHTPHHRLAELPEDLRSRMRLIHYPDGFDETAGPIAFLREGEPIVLQPRRGG